MCARTCMCVCVCVHVQDEKYAHLDKADVEKVQKCLDDKTAWWGPKMEAQSRIKPFEAPVLLVSQVFAEMKVYLFTFFLFHN